MSKFSLFEIDRLYQAVQDKAEAWAAEHNGEIPPDFDIELTVLEMSRDEKIENCIKWYKNQNAIADMIEAELDALKTRAKAHRNSADRVKAAIGYIVQPGEKVEYGCGKIGWRGSSQLIIDNPDKVPQEFIKVETSIKKQEIKDAIKDGMVVDYAHIEQFQNISIK